jgi:hypothetical protein
MKPVSRQFLALLVSMVCWVLVSILHTAVSVQVVVDP